jgi:hypothetical protein
VSKKKSKDQPPDQVIRRDVNWRFILQALLNLEVLGFLLFLDNEETPGHGTVVRIRDITEESDWILAHDRLPNGPYMPRAAASLYRGGEGEDLDVVLKSTAFDCVPDREPEMFYVEVFKGDGEDIVFPKARPVFQTARYLHEGARRAAAIETIS